MRCDILSDEHYIFSEAYKFTTNFFLYSICIRNTLFVPEPKLQNALARALSAEPDSLTRICSKKLEFFEFNNVGLRDLTGSTAKNLKVLVLKDNLIENIEPLTGFSHLRKLDLSGNRISTHLHYQVFH